MTESERPNRAGRITSDFFICFSSRSSSSSMKISSKSILSPGRTDKFREPTLSLSSSLSRRLRNNGSMKGGQSSPMFPTGSKKKGCAFETPEPSSPKVTCIGQVRVKTKKKQGMKKLRTRSKRRGEVSFRKTEQTPEGIVRQRHRNQRWVHLPLTICEALRGLGAEFNCFLPCSGRSGCSWASERKVEKRTTSTSSCGAVFAKWLWALEEGEEKRREMKLEGGEEKREIREKVVGEIGIDISEEKEEEIEEEEERRVSICVPPRNALLLMRCRSEPMRMSAFANRFWDSEVSKDEEEENVVEQREEEDEEDAKVTLETEEEEKMLEKWVFGETIEEVENLQKEENPDTGEEEMLEKWVLAEITKVENPQKEENPEEQKDQEIPDNAEQQEELIEEKDEDEEEIMVSGFSSEALEEEKDNLETEETKEEEEEEEEEEEKSRESFSCSTEHVQAEEAHESEPGPETAGLEGVEKSTEEKETEEEERETEERFAAEEEEEEEDEERKSKGGEEVLLPDCLLMMMYEPKLSMEVSKETWVCSTDFIRRPRNPHPEKQQVIQMDGGDKSKKRLSVDSNPAQVHPAAHQQEQQLQQQQHHQLPPRFSCSKLELTVDPSMATMIEHKLVNAVAYEPLVLTRCNSEPMRSSAKQAPDASCFWKNRKMEPCWNRLLSSQAEPI